MLGISLRIVPAKLAAAIVLLLSVASDHSAQGQTFQVIHSFTGTHLDGADPEAGLIMDAGGNLYGTTAFGGHYNCAIDFGCGTVFRLTHRNSVWILNPLYTFAASPGAYDGASPAGRVTFGPDGSLYGTTSFGGSGACNGFGLGCGTVFNLKPPATACKTAVCPWTEAVLYSFGGGSDGALPQGDLIFDQPGNIYGTTTEGGIVSCGRSGCGVVYKLAPANGQWTESILHRFTGGSDGGSPYGGVISDKSGNLLGTTAAGGAYGYGTVYELRPSGSGWTENVLFSFSGGTDGFEPLSGLIFDGSGNLYGSTSGGGSGGGGTVFMLSPSNGTWTFTLLYSFTGYAGPYGSLVMDASGNLYGTTFDDGAFKLGSAFKLSPGSNGWTYTSLYDFTGTSDGAEPISNLVFDASGNLYGTTWLGGVNYGCTAYGPGCGVVFEVTP
jgi:uncharacterized repeat protein (TIGR03803 family)